MPDEAELQTLAAAELRTLADLLDAGSAEQWDTASLCEGWRVREVVAHMSMPARYTDEQFTAGLREHNFDFTRYSDQVASADAELPVTELTGSLRSPTLHRWVPPQGGSIGALTHAVVHGLDATVPLDVPRHVDPVAVRAVLDSLIDGGHRRFGVDLDRRRLEATDLDWGHGDGEPLRAGAEELVSMLAGRSVPDTHFEGAALTVAR